LSSGGRPKEEGGHKDLHITLCASITKFLESVENKSKVIEEAVHKTYEKKPKRRFHFIVGIPEIGDEE